MPYRVSPRIARRDSRIPRLAVYPAAVNVMKIALALALSLLASCASTATYGHQQESAAPTPAHAGGRDNHVSLYFGQRSLDEDDWAPLEDQTTFGIEFWRESPDNPVGFEVGIMGSSDEGDVGGFDFEVSTGELYAGVRKSFGDQAVHPYLGGGLSFINAEVELSGGGSDDDSSAAIYAHGGVLFDVSESMYLGLDVRTLIGSDLSIAGVSTDADYVQFAAMIGFGF